MNKVINYLIERYNATYISPKHCEEYMQAGDEIEAALSFPDKKNNYMLMSEYDLEAFTLEERELIEKKKEAPFEEPILIFYKNSKGEDKCKLVNGMLSGIFRIVDNMKE